MTSRFNDEIYIQDDIANASLTPWKSGEEWGESSSEKKRLETALSDK